MERPEILILLGNLIRRIEREEDGSGRLSGVITLDEIAALEEVVESFASRDVDLSPGQSKKGIRYTPEADSEAVGDQGAHPLLDLGASSVGPPPENERLCLDFGTAMSKATLVLDRLDDREEEIYILPLGVPGDQQEVSEKMLLSSVYIDNDAILRFGNAAYEQSRLESEDGSRLRLDNIKRRLSEDGWDEQPGRAYNPTDYRITYGDLVLAYLAFMTWTVNECLRERGISPYIARRFALPSLGGQKQREAVGRLRRLMGEAQVLADTFGKELRDGLPLARFVAAVDALKEQPTDYPFVDSEIAEPLGVAGSMVSWLNPVDNLIMVVDIGAGTSDFGLFRIHVDPKGHSEGVEVEGSSRCITEAGNYLDNILVELILKRAKVTSDHPKSTNIRRRMSLRIREYKERMFNEGEVFVLLDEPGVESEVNIDLEEFMKEEAVRRFGESLHEQMVDIVNKVDESWVGWVQARPDRKLVIALTGGGAELPMVRKLAQGPLAVNGREVSVAPARIVPEWLSSLDENIASDYVQAAVSLGGARKRVMDQRRANITGGDVGRPEIGGYFQKGE